MRYQKWRVVFTVCLFVFMPIRAYADSAASPNYQVDQTFFGAGGELYACSAGSEGYCSKQTAGELGIGNIASNTYQAYAGFNTTEAPYIEFVVTSSSVDLGYLDPGYAKVTAGQFYVRVWQAGGYVVRTESDPPDNGHGHQLAPLAAATGSSPGTEQFGINLVDNASPDIGLDPLQANGFSTGQVEPGYDTPDQFKYNKGDVVARSLTSSSVTTYTVSYLFNIDYETPSGNYVFNHILVATGTY